MSQNPEPLGFSYAYRDLLIALMIAFMALSAMAILAKLNDDSANKNTLSLTMQWDKNSAVDVDMHIRTPDDPDVYWNNTHGRDCDLVHDDLGSYADPKSRTEEVAYCRHPTPGHYIANAAVYTPHNGTFPVHVELIIRDGANAILVDAQGVLTGDGDEITFVQWDVGPDHRVIAASISHFPDYFVTHKVVQ